MTRVKSADPDSRSKPPTPDSIKSLIMQLNTEAQQGFMGVQARLMGSHKKVKAVYLTENQILLMWVKQKKEDILNLCSSKLKTTFKINKKHI